MLASLVAKALVNKSEEGQSTAGGNKEEAQTISGDRPRQTLMGPPVIPVGAGLRTGVSTPSAPVDKAVRSGLPTPAPYPGIPGAFPRAIFRPGQQPAQKEG